MDFTLDQDQAQLQASIDRFLGAKYDLRARKRLLDDREGKDRLWREMADLGWIGAAFPEAAGGYGASRVEAMIVAEGFGRHLVVEPYVITAIVCGGLLCEDLSEPRRALVGEVIEGRLQLALAMGGSRLMQGPEYPAFAAERAGGDFVLNGRTPVVINGDRADRLLVAARTGGAAGERQGVTLFLVDARSDRVARRGFRTIDDHGAAEVAIEGLAVSRDDIIGELDGAVPLIERALDHGAAAICAEAVGSMTHLVEATAAYTKGREQYGAPLANFQVLQHRMADMYIQTETARSMAYLATLSLDAPASERLSNLSAAKVQVGRSGKFVGYQAVQLHGGMGVSDELDIGHHYVRLTVINKLFGDQAFHLRRFAELSDRMEPADLELA